MSALLSDGSIHMKTAWLERSSTGSPSADVLLPQPQPPSSVHKAYEPTFVAPFAPFAHKLAPITTAFESRQSVSSDRTPSTYSSTLRSSQATSPPQSPPCRSAKRPRWHYHQRSEYYGNTPRTGSSPSHSSGHHERHNDIVWAENDARTSHGTQACANCSGTQTIVEDIVTSLLGLDIEIRQALKVFQISQNNSEHSSNEITKRGLKYSLNWASRSIRSTKLMVRDATGTEIPSLGYSNAARADYAPQSDPSGMTSVPGDYHTSRKPILYDKTHADHLTYSRTPSSQEDLTSRFPDPILPPLLSATALKKAYHLEPAAALPEASPRRPSSSSVFGSGPLSSQSQPSHRTLPSPSPFQFPSLGPSLAGNHSPTHNPAAQAAHLQDLQHQISTKTLALQTLQREHDQLLAAFSRSQTRCSALDKKSQVSDHEIDSLTEEKIRLQQLVEALETQVEELLTAREQAQKQAATEGQQWRQIMAMGSQLQVQGAEQAKRYKADKESWERDREGLQNRIRELEAGKLTTAQTRDGGEDTASVSPDDLLASASLDVLREEVLKSCRSCANMEAMLRDIRSEAGQMDHTMTTMAQICERIISKTQASLHEPSD